MRCEALQLRFRKEGHGHDERARNTGNLDFHIHRSHDINYVFDCRRASHASLSAGVHGENNSRSATMSPVEKLTVEGFIRVRHNDTTMKRVRHEWAVSRRWGLREVPIRSNRFLDSGSREQQIYRSLEWFIRARQYDTRLINARHARSAVVKEITEGFYPAPEFDTRIKKCRHAQARYVFSLGEEPLVASYPHASVTIIQ
jgi:hypothetical protein